MYTKSFQLSKCYFSLEYTCENYNCVSRPMVELRSQLNWVTWAWDKIPATSFWCMLSRQWSKLYIFSPLLSSNNSKTLLGKVLYYDHWWAYSDIAAQHLQQELGFPSWGEEEALGETHSGGRRQIMKRFQESGSWRLSWFSGLHINWFARKQSEAFQPDLLLV